MLTTLREILVTKGVPLQDTVYGRADDRVLDFPINIGDFFEAKSTGDGVRDLVILNRLHGLIQEKRRSREYDVICSQLNEVEARLKEIKSRNVNSNEELIPEKLKLRKLKKSLNETKLVLEAKYFEQSTQEIKREFGFGHGYLQYKDSFYCTNFADIATMLPQIEDVDTPKLRQMPLFVRGIWNLAVALRKGAPLGIIGGPCLFGAYEVLIDIVHKDGEIVQFDFSTGKNYDRGRLAENDLESYLSARYQDIVQLDLTNHKVGVTYQEYLSMQYLFEFALALDAPVVIPIPDMSYMKFFEGITTHIGSEVKEAAFKDFEQISYDITDMYLSVIDDLRLKYPEVECQVLHSRNLQLCELFYERRQPFVCKLSRQGRVTEYVGRTEAVIDYITMLALPYYIYGTRHVLQIDSVDEADSMRKCMKIHDPEVAFHSILFPEYLSADKMNTVYNAPLEFKDYYVYAGG